MKDQKNIFDEKKKLITKVEFEDFRKMFSKDLLKIFSKDVLLKSFEKFFNGCTVEKF